MNSSKTRSGLYRSSVPNGTNLGKLIGDLHFSLPFDCGGKGRCGKCLVGLAPLPEEFRSSHPKAEKQIVFISQEDQYKGSFEKVLACTISIDRDLLIELPNLEKALSPIFMEKIQKKQDPGKEYGIAIDLGSTTIAAALVDLKNRETIGICSSLNPQIARGSDIISRISYAVQGDPERKELQNLARDQIANMIDSLARETGIPHDRIVKMSVAGNTVMEYLFLGLDPAPLGQHPFEPPVRQFPVVSLQDLPDGSFPISPKAKIFLFPILAGFVGGDIVSGLYDLKNRGLSDVLAKKSKAAELFLDLGTNGEMVLIQEGELTVAATAAGPAFEGAGIRYGMSGLPGAIEKAEFRSHLSLRTIGGKEPRGICGSGLVDLIALLLDQGIIDPGGRFCKKNDPRFSKIDPDLATRMEIDKNRPIFRLNEKGKPPICLTQKDIRQVQLAAGAIRGGIRLLAEEKMISFKDFKKIFIAGGFGNHLQMKNAFRIGLLPGEAGIRRCKYLGNSSLNGAISSLYDSCYLKHIQEFIRNARQLDLASLPRFQKVFVDSIVFPAT
ncbi:MAG: ASKHA domain-containing protein [Planctomycetia bacterium]|nr:ASKHA domain-containing protein [Planctomycetia bacterium]